ncbi:MAG: glycosyltransferase family 39 protein [Candidatus Marinimicrobia bacterium]|jgi:hypothetical protein|nr:glycosyltransferase family 39 protein [Candidatus Neomarinimicrobiota bacterium]MDD5062597.1 glycosyltransferase family 39 protein [Candidatus Neomarinimicrobiota bacterium]
MKLKNFIIDYGILILLIAGKFILQFLVVNPIYELHRDEFLYLNQANHLAAGYISVPPLTAFISRLILMLGGGLFWIRFVPALFGALTIVLVWLIIKTLGGKLFTQILVGCAMLFSIMVRLNILYQPNAFDILIWTAMFYFLIKYLRSEKSYWLFALAISAALGINNKYTVIFLLVGLLVGILLSPRRKILASRNFYLALLVGLIILLPNIIWQIKNQFPVLKHMQALNAYQLVNNSAWIFLTQQYYFFMGSIPLTLVGLWSFFAYKPFRNYIAIGIGYLIVIGLFAILKAKGYYAAGFYPIMFAFGGLYLEKILPGIWKSVIFAVLILFNLSVFASIYKYMHPVQTPAEIIADRPDYEKRGMLRWEDGRNHDLPQDFADMLGWQEMAEKAWIAFQMLTPEERSQTLIFSDNYGQAGALNYYNRKKMPECYSFNTDYIDWLPYLDTIKNIVLVGEKPPASILKMFNEHKLIGVDENQYAREKGTEIYLLLDAKAEFTRWFYQTAHQRRETWDIF